MDICMKLVEARKLGESIVASFRPTETSLTRRSEIYSFDIPFSVILKSAICNGRKGEGGWEVGK